MGFVSKVVGGVGDAIGGVLGTVGDVVGGAVNAITGGGGGGGSSAPVTFAPVPDTIWGKGTPLVSGGINPGDIQKAAMAPEYHSANPTDAQYNWSVHAPVLTATDLKNYNQLPAGAPAVPFGAGPHAVGGQDQFDPQEFVNQYILNPAYAGVNNATSPGYTGPAVPTVKG
jgi:hypothetical protein